MKGDVQSGSLLHGIPGEIPQEMESLILDGGNISIRRILSKGQSSPETGWYDQADNEWVLVVKGEAILAFDDGNDLVMAEGDYCYIPAHRKHRVKWTDANRETVWLAVHFPAGVA